MSIKTIIAENQTTSPVYIQDLDVTVPASGSVELTDSSFVYEIRESKDLLSQIQVGNIIINDDGDVLSQLESEASLSPAGENLTAKDSNLLNGQDGDFYRNASNLNSGTLPAARFNDTSHGNRVGGSLHALATGAIAGFMSAADKLKLDALSGGQAVYDAIVDASGSGDYTLPSAAFAAGAKSVWVKGGTYIESSNVVIPENGILDGELDATIVFSGSVGIVIDGNGGVEETAGTISISNGSSTVTGSGTSFTNLSPGNSILIGTVYYTIGSITSDTVLELSSVYTGVSVSGQDMFAIATLNGVSVRNITVVGSSGTALFVRAALGCFFSGLTLSGNATNIEIINSSSVSIQSSASYNASGNGITVTGSRGVGFVTVESVNNAGDGFHINGESTTIYITACKSSTNGQAGVNITGNSVNATVFNSIVCCNSGKGINIDPGCDNVSIAGCSVTGSGSTGIDIDGSDTVVDNCLITDSGSYGVQSGRSALISNCHIDSNGDSGIVLQSGDNDNTIIGNHISSNSGDGIFFESGGSDESTVVGNVISNNTGFGISIATSNDNNVISGNSIISNSSGQINNLEPTTKYSLEYQGNPSQGDLAYFDGTNWNRLGVGGIGQVLTSNGSIPNWESASSVPGQFFIPIWGERSGSISDGATFAYGNGDNAFGITIPFDCEIFAIATSHTDVGTSTVEPTINEVATGDTLTTTNSKQNFAILPTPRAVTAGDVVGSIAANGTGNGGGGGIRVCIWLRATAGTFNLVDGPGSSTNNALAKWNGNYH
jgi:parallel beta-helix repeat protein